MSTRLQILLISIFALMAALGFTATALVLHPAPVVQVPNPPASPAESAPPESPSLADPTMDLINAVRLITRLPLGDGGEMVFVGRGLKNADGVFPYELWQFDTDQNGRLIAAGKGESYCSTQDFATTTGGLLKFSLWNSPCEAGYSEEDFYYDQTRGEEQLRSTFNSFDGFLSYEEPRSPRNAMRISLELEGACSRTGDARGSVLLKGVRLSELGEGATINRLFPVPEKRLDCQEAYGGEWTNPTFKGAGLFDGRLFSVKLPDETIVQFDLGRDENDPAFFVK